MTTPSKAEKRPKVIGSCSGVLTYSRYDADAIFESLEDELREARGNEATASIAWNIWQQDSQEKRAKVESLETELAVTRRALEMAAAYTDVDSFYFMNDARKERGQ